MLDVTLLPVLQDNYAYLFKSGDDIGILDPGEAGPIIAYCEEHDLKPNYIFNTHHHGDHIAGNRELLEMYDAELIAPAKEVKRITNIKHTVSEGDVMSFGDEEFHVIEAPGHTMGHICFHFPKSEIVFVGDVIFSMGCGRLFEGTPQEMFESMAKLKALPDQTKVYCGHEYTLQNGYFCLSIDPENSKLIDRVREVESLYEQGKPSLPTTIGLEKDTNVFFRARTVEEFIQPRALKDSA